MRRPVITDRNSHQWQHIAAFLASLPVRGNAAPGKRSAGAALARFQAIPVGNHGDNRTSIK